MEKRGNFPSKRVCQHTKPRKEQQWVKQWALVFQHSTCPIIYTPLTGAILKSVIGGKLFVSKCLAHSESTPRSGPGWLMTCGLIVRRWLINYRLTEETRYENPPLITPNFFFSSSWHVEALTDKFASSRLNVWARWMASENSKQPLI